MAEVKNFSRHDFNADQVRVLPELFPGAELGAPLAPFFKSAEDFASKVSGTTSSVVVPMEIMLDALSAGLLADGTIISPPRDEEARKRGRFASRGVAAYRLREGRWEKVVSRDMVPTVEVGFQDGMVVPYAPPSEKK